MSTTIFEDESVGKITQREAYLLIDKYLDAIEDLEDYISIQNHSRGKVEYLSESETKDLFDSQVKR